VAGAIAAAAGAVPLADAATGQAASAPAASGTAGHASVKPDSHSLLASESLLAGSAVPQPADGGPVSAQAAAPSAAKAARHSAQPASTAATSAAGHTAAGHPATVKPAAAPKHAAKRAAAKKHAARHAAATSKPFTLYDSVTPGAIPAGQRAAVYSNGKFQASAAAAAGHGKVLWIDVNGSNTRADALDVEPGDATPAGAAAWVKAKLTADPHSTAIVYTFKSAWGDVISNINGLPGWMHGHVRYWIADPTGTPHILPGSTATQWYWGPSYDISSAAAGFTS
jgi:hypothetical protein